jgi:hypothetical protein
MLTRLLSSPRRRRRLAWLVPAGVIAGTAVGVATQFTVSADHGLTKPRPGRPQVVAPSPRTVPFAPEEKAVEAVALQFVQSAVLRDRPARSYDLVTPTLRESLTRAQWATGAIPVVPYPAEAVKSVRWRLGYSYRDRVELRIAILAKDAAAVGSQNFDIELRTAGSGAKRHWLVHSWTPAGGPSSASLPPGRKAAEPTMPRARLGGGWLLVPVGVLLGLIVLVPLLLGVRGWARSRRAERSALAHSAPGSRTPGL